MTPVTQQTETEQLLQEATALRSRIAARTGKSAVMAEARAEVINAAMAASGDSPPSIFIKNATGAHFEDLDGNRYLDLCMGFGVHILGHRPDVVKDALARQLENGWHFSLRGAEQLAFAELIRDAGPANDRVVFCNSGTEATLYAMRAARAVTGKTRIGQFVWSYHGAHDAVLFMPDPSSDPANPKPEGLGHGIPASAIDDVLYLPYRDPRAFELIRENAAGLAAIMVEPVQGTLPMTDGLEAFLRELEAVCRDLGILLIADEVLTGFRLGYGGAQETFNFTADLTTYGKAMGGGLPIGVISGRHDIMRSFGDFTQDHGIFFGGTFSGNPLTVAAGRATLSHLAAHPGIYSRMTEKGIWLRDQFNAAAKICGAPVSMIGTQSLFKIFFMDGPATSFGYIGRERESLFYLACLDRGLFIHATKRCFLSAAHSWADVNFALDVMVDALDQAYGHRAQRDAA